jgi:predicted nucleotidyltransferase
MLSEWRKFAGWALLEHFLNNPNRESYIREIARSLDMSPRSVQVYCDLYEKDSIFLSEHKARVREIRLNNELPLVKGLKRAYFLVRLNESAALKAVVEKNPGMISLAIYGSYAAGENDERSDIDIFVVSDRKVDRTPFLKLEKELAVTIQLTEMNLAKWISLKKKRDRFADSVLTNCIVIHGVRL